ncbi:hypothetical protein OS493_023206 [Desmophyllum pertusum]|uniref:Uncharacterized protein n=1 Tax=Desmophyllum pertusum TaxID=174260 RepID=A0A9W9YM12_9CNID|nr:hypothetical protein OS493_023206 [Desmophyllum pertusum]
MYEAYINKGLDRGEDYIVYQRAVTHVNDVILGGDVSKVAKISIQKFLKGKSYEYTVVTIESQTLVLQRIVIVIAILVKVTNTTERESAHRILIPEVQQLNVEVKWPQNPLYKSNLAGSITMAESLFRSKRTKVGTQACVTDVLCLSCSAKLQWGTGISNVPTIRWEMLTVDDKGMLCPICETRFMCTKALCVPRRKNLPRQNDVLDYFPKKASSPLAIVISAEAQPL